MIRNTNERILELVESMCKDITVELESPNSLYITPQRYLTNGVPLTHIYHDVKCFIDENEELKETITIPRPNKGKHNENSSGRQRYVNTRKT